MGFPCLPPILRCTHRAKRKSTCQREWGRFRFRFRFAYIPTSFPAAHPAPQLRSVHLRRRSCPSQGRFRGLLDKHGRGRRSVGPLACGMLAAICRRESSVLAKASAEPCNAASFCLGFPDRSPMQGLLARLVGRYAQEAVRSAGFAKAREGQHPHRIAGDEPMSPGILWGVARAARSGASRATAPRRLSGHAAGGVSSRGGGGERSPWPPRRVWVCRGGSGSRCTRGTGAAR